MQGRAAALHTITFWFLHFLQLATSSIEGFFGRMMELVQDLYNQFKNLGNVADILGRIFDMILSGADFEDIQKVIPDIQKLMEADIKFDDIIDM